MQKSILFILILLCTSCSVTTFYQTYKAIPLNGSINANSIQFEDSNCIINYNLYGNQGKMSFTIYNKTKEDIVIDLTKTFFIINSNSTQYFQNRISKEQTQITIPSKTRIQFSQFTIISKRFINHNLAKFPTEKNFNSISYTKENSPFQFSNLISYVIDNTPYRFENPFFVSEIANYPSSNFLHRIITQDKLDYKPKTNIPSHFFLKYTRAD